MSQLYGAAKTEKIFSLADYFRQEERKKVRLEGMRERDIAIAKQMLAEGESNEKISRYTGLSLQDIEALV